MRQGRVLPVMVLAVGLAVQVMAAVHLAGRLWFFGDDWDFLLRRGVTAEAERSIWEAHNEHWSTVPILLFRLAYAGVGLEHYLPYALLPVTAHVATWIVLYLLVRKAGIGPWPAVVGTWISSFLAAGAGAQNVLWAFQIGFLGSATFGLLGLHFAQGDRRWQVPAAWLALTLSLASSGIGMIFVGWAGLLVLLRDGLVRALVVASIPAAAFAIWLMAAQQSSGSTGSDVASVPMHLARGLDAVWSVALGVPGAGALVLVGLACAVLLAPQSRPSFALTASGLAALLAAFAIFAFARSGLGDDAATRSRYLYFGVLFCAPAVALAVEQVGGRLAVRWSVPVVVAVALGGTALVGLAQLGQWADDREATIGDEREEIAAAARLIDGGEPLFTEYVGGDDNPDVMAMNLRPAIGRLRGVDVDAETMLEVRSRLQVVIRAGGPAASDHCVKRDVDDAHRVLELDVPVSGVAIAVETGHNDDIETSLIAAGHESDQTEWRVPARGYVTVASRATGARLRVELPTGSAIICPRVMVPAPSVDL